MSDSQWLIRIEGGLSAHFIQPDGSSRPGTDWSVGLKRGNETYNVMVRAYLSDDLTKKAQADKEYQGQTVLNYIWDLLDRGWTPDQEHNHSIVIQNPSPEPAKAEHKPWWRFW